MNTSNKIALLSVLLKLLDTLFLVFAIVVGKKFMYFLLFTFPNFAFQNMGENMRGEILLSVVMGLLSILLLYFFLWRIIRTFFYTSNQVLLYRPFLLILKKELTEEEDKDYERS